MIVDGTLTINAVTDKVTVTITENKDRNIRRHGKDSNRLYGNRISNPLYTVKRLHLQRYSQREATDAGVYNMDLKPADFTNNSTNFTDVEF